MAIFGNKIRELREAKNLKLRELAASLDIDSATLSKIERGVRNASKNQVFLLSEALNYNLSELKSLWLANKIYEIIGEEEEALKAIQVAEKEIKYQSKQT